MCGSMSMAITLMPLTGVGTCSQLSLAKPILANLCVRPSHSKLSTCPTPIAAAEDSAGKKPQGNWRQFSPKSEKPGRQLLDTLELVYATTQWPSDDTIQSFWVLHRMPRHQVRHSYGVKMILAVRKCREHCLSDIKDTEIHLYD